MTRQRACGLSDSACPAGARPPRALAGAAAMPGALATPRTRASMWRGRRSFSQTTSRTRLRRGSIIRRRVLLPCLGDSPSVKPYPARGAASSACDALVMVAQSVRSAALRHRSYCTVPTQDAHFHKHFNHILCKEACCVIFVLAPLYVIPNPCWRPCF